MPILDQYPKLSLTDATQCLNLYQEATLLSKDVQNRTVGNFEQKSEMQEVEETLIRLFEIATEVELTGTKNAQQFHTLSSIELHKSFKDLGVA